MDGSNRAPRQRRRFLRSAAAVKTAEHFVRDAGFEPVVVGPLARAIEFDTGTPVYGKALTASELRRGLGINP